MEIPGVYLYLREEKSSLKCVTFATTIKNQFAIPWQLTNHLGNVLAIVSDEKIRIDLNNDGAIDYYTTDVVTAQDYYSFGMEMPGRTFRGGAQEGTLSNAEGYRYGFNGKENDKDITEGAQDYGMRISDNRLGRFLSVDPMTKSYPWYTPYQFAGNKPIWATDLDGMEERPTNDGNTTRTEYSTTSTSADLQSTKGPFLETVSKTWFWHKGSNEYGTKAGWYDKDEYAKVISPIARDLAGYLNLYSSPVSSVSRNNWGDKSTEYVVNTKLGNFFSSGISEEGAKAIAAQAYSTAMARIGSSTGRADFSPVNAEDLLIVGQLVKLGAKELFKNAAKTGGLADDVAKTFRFGRYTEVTLDKPMVLSRYYDNANAFAKGRFMINSTSGFTSLDRIRMAIRPSCNGMTKVAHWEIPAGSTIYQGRAAMQFPWLGGKTQYFVPELGNIKRVIR